MHEAQEIPHEARQAFDAWQLDIQKNSYTTDIDFMHSIQFYFPNHSQLQSELAAFGELVPAQLEKLAQENNLDRNLPYLNAYNSIGERIDQIVHHPSYTEAGDIIYNTQLLAKLTKSGGLLECLSFLFLSGQAGEAGHNCPIACSAGIIRILLKFPYSPDRDFYLKKLTSPSYQTNFTGAQFLTELQGGSDVGLNAVYAQEDEQGNWRIDGEKWFCSNVGADLILTTARYDRSKKGTKGLGLFLVPAKWQDRKNHYTIHRLKDKIGTRSMATGEIEYQGAYALLIGSLEEGFRLVMNNVLHLSRLFNSFCVLGMARRAYRIAQSYAKHRVAFGHPILHYPLIQELLATIKAENSAMLAGVFATAHLQDQMDLGKLQHDQANLLLRLLVNLQKYLTSRHSVEHIHHAIDVLAGNGAIETFSALPRLLRDCIVCENWEGTHNTLRMQILKDMQKYQIEQIYLDYMQGKIQSLNQAESRVQILFKKLHELTQELQAFRQLMSEVQLLQIQVIVDKMAILFCGLMLLIEALDQQKTTKSTSKLDCFDYFSLKCLQTSDVIYDKTYIELCARIASYNLATGL